jgi:hypothetical protein
VDILTILSGIILFTTIATLLIAVVAYYAFKLRDKRKPKKKATASAAVDEGMTVLLQRFVPSSDQLAELRPIVAINGASEPNHSSNG